MLVKDSTGISKFHSVMSNVNELSIFDLIFKRDILYLMSEHQPPCIRYANESECDCVQTIVPLYRVDRTTKNSTRSSLRRQDR